MEKRHGLGFYITVSRTIYRCGVADDKNCGAGHSGSFAAGADLRDDPVLQDTGLEPYHRNVY